jgi:hypothetical protein
LADNNINDNTTTARRAGAAAARAQTGTSGTRCRRRIPSQGAPRPGRTRDGVSAQKQSPPNTPKNTHRAKHVAGMADPFQPVAAAAAQGGAAEHQVRLQHAGAHAAPNPVHGLVHRDAQYRVVGGVDDVVAQKGVGLPGPGRLPEPRDHLFGRFRGRYKDRGPVQKQPQVSKVLNCDAEVGDERHRHRGCIRPQPHSGGRAGMRCRPRARPGECTCILHGRDGQSAGR